MTSEKDGFTKFLAEYRISLCVFRKNLLQNKQSNRCSIIIIIIQHRFRNTARNLTTSFFSNVMKFQNARLLMVRNQTNLFSEIRELEEHGPGHLFIISISCHFFNKLISNTAIFYSSKLLPKLTQISFNVNSLLKR